MKTTPAYSSGATLDVWGNLFGLRRQSGEVDDAFRQRLTAHMRVPPRPVVVNLTFSFSKHYEFDKGNQRLRAILAQRAKK